jgi:hypothetical protein
MTTVVTAVVGSGGAVEEGDHEDGVGRDRRR